MIVTYHGGHTIKLTQGSFTIAINPPSSDSDQKFNRFGADIVLESARHPDVSGGHQLNSGQKDPFVVSGPGEYEKEGLFIHGVASNTSYKNNELLNTIYYFTYDDISVCVLGLHESGSLPTAATELIDEVDVLILPVSGEGVMTPVEAHKLGIKLEPGIMIPTGFDDLNNPDLQVFLKEADISGKALDKLTFKKADLNELDNVIVLNAV